MALLEIFSQIQAQDRGGFTGVVVDGWVVEVSRDEVVYFSLVIDQTLRELKGCKLGVSLVCHFLVHRQLSTI